jgi:F-type H+-transporting ATPase subunit a
MEHRPFTWFSLLAPFPEHAVTGSFVALLLVVFAAVVHRKLVAGEQALEPDDGVTVRNVAEVLVELVTGLAEGVIGNGAHAYVPLLATFFAFILVGNLLGLVPGFTPPTSDFNVTFALGVVSFVAYQTYGVRRNGLAYVKHFAGPVLLLAPLMVVIELFGHVFRPVSLAVRLFANMFADHKLLEIFTDLTWIVVPVAFYMLGTLVSVVQAFVFTMLSATYIALAVGHEH